MSISIDLSSKIEHRIDQDLFDDESDDFPLPGISRRASLTQSMSDVTGLLNTSKTEPDHSADHESQHELDTDVSRSRASERTSSFAAELQHVDERLLDTSDSIEIPGMSENTEEQRVFEHENKSDHELLTHSSFGKNAKVELSSSSSHVDGESVRTLNTYTKNHSSSSLSMPPSPSESCAQNASASASLRRGPLTRSAQRLSVPSSPSTAMNKSLYSATTPIQLPAPGRVAFLAAPSAMPAQHGEHEESHTSGLSGLSTHAQMEHKPAPTLPRRSQSVDEPSVAHLMSSTSSLQDHIDPQRLIAYQHQVNERLTHENELLKVQCEELMKMVQQHDISKHEEKLVLVNQINSLQQTVDAQRREMTELKDRAQPDTPPPPPPPSAHTPLLARIEHALNDKDANAMQSCIQELNAVVPCATLLSAEPDTSRPSDASVRSRSTSSWRHSTPRQCATMDSLKRSVASMSMASDMSNVTTDLRHMQRTVRTLTHELHETRTQLDAALLQSTEANASKLRIEARLASTVDELADVKATLAVRIEQCRALEAMRKSMPRSDASMDRSLRKAHADVAAAQALQQQAQQQQSLLKEHLRIASERFERACADADDARHARIECEAQIDEQLLQLHSLQNLLAEQQTELGQLRGEKDHLGRERREIMEQLNVFEQRLRDVRTETEQYGSDLRALQEREDRLAERARHMDEECERLVHVYVAEAMQSWQKPQQAKLARLEEQCGALVFQKAYLSRALHAQAWLTERVRVHLNALAPTFAPYVTGYEAHPPKPRSWRAKLRAVQFVVRLRRIVD